MRFGCSSRGATARQGAGPSAPLVVVALLAVAALAGCGLVGGGSGGGSGGGAGGGSRATSTLEPAVTPRTAPAETREGVPYATGSPRQTLDLYLPAGDGRTVYPLVVLIHGGGFFSGDSGDLADTAQLLASKGFAAASVNYRLSGDAPYPAAVQDVAASVRYLRANARSWGVDPHKIAVWGESAGGYLAAMMGVAGGKKRFRDDGLGNAGVSSEVQAVVAWFAPSDFSTMDEQARAAGCAPDAQVHGQVGSPESRWLGGALADVPDLVTSSSVVRAVSSASSLPPYFLVHGAQDCTVPTAQSRQLEAALAARDAKVTLTVVPGAHHADPKIDESQVRPSLEFLRSVFQSSRPAGDGS